MNNILPENIINKEYAITITPTIKPNNRFSRFFLKIISLRNKYMTLPTVRMTFQKIKKLQGRHSFQDQVQTINQTPHSSNKYDSNENIYCTIGEIQGDVKSDKYSNNKESDYIIMYNFSDQKQQISSQNNDTIKQQENIYVEMLSPYINLRFLPQQNITSSDYIDDEHIYETIQVANENTRFHSPLKI
jgi:hypothetical protein